MNDSCKHITSGWHAYFSQMALFMRVFPTFMKALLQFHEMTLRILDCPSFVVIARDYKNFDYSYTARSLSSFLWVFLVCFLVKDFSSFIIYSLLTGTLWIVTSLAFDSNDASSLPILSSMCYTASFDTSIVGLILFPSRTCILMLNFF